MDVHHSTIPAATIERFWSKVDTSAGPDACWPWIAYRGQNGYGEIWQVLFATRYAHRIAYMLSLGEIPPGLFVLHRCDNRPCCNPAHLWLGTIADNNADMVAKGRQQKGNTHWSHLAPEKVQRGQAASKAKLTERQVLDILDGINAGETQSELARTYGVTYQTISKIACGETWRHVRSGRAPS